MKFVYTGEAPKGSIQQYGYTFTPGVPVDVTDDFAIRKLTGNQFFKVARMVREQPAAEPEAEAEPEAPKPNKGGRPKKAKAGDNGDGGGAG